jgi:hypothetical protein
LKTKVQKDQPLAPTLPVKKFGQWIANFRNVSPTTFKFLAAFRGI